MSDIIARGMAANAMSSGGGGGGGTTVDAYNKQETDSLLRGKANASDVYTTTQTDDLLDDKVNKVNGKGLSTNDYTNEDMSLVKTISNKANTNDVNASVTNLQNQISETSENVDTINTELMTNAGYSLGMSINPTTFELTMTLKNSTGGTVSSQKVDLPIESMVVSASYANGKLSLKLQNGQTLDTDISAIVAGLVNQNFTIAGIDMKDNIEANELRTALGVYTTTEVDNKLGQKANASTTYSKTEVDNKVSVINTNVQANTTAINATNERVTQNESDILLRIPRTYGAASSNNTNHYNKWYKLGRFETVTTNNTFNSIFLVHDRKGRENGLLTITIEKATSGGIVSAFASTIKAEWISAEYQTSSNYRKENNFVIVAWVEGTKLICELWCRIYEAWGCYHALKLVDNRMTQDISSVSYGSETGWVMEKTSTPYDNHPEASDTVRVVYSVDRIALALRPTTINNSKDNPKVVNDEIVLTRPYTDFNVLTVTLNTSANDDTTTRHIIDIPVQGITFASRYVIVCGSETGTVRFDKLNNGNIKMIGSSFEELYVISVDGRK